MVCPLSDLERARLARHQRLVRDHGIFRLDEAPCPVLETHLDHHVLEALAWNAAHLAFAILEVVAAARSMGGQAPSQ